MAVIQTIIILHIHSRDPESEPESPYCVFSYTHSMPQQRLLQQSMFERVRPCVRRSSRRRLKRHPSVPEYLPF